MIEWIDGFDTYGSGGADISAAMAGNWAEFGAFDAITFDNTRARTGTYSATSTGQGANTTMRRVFSDNLDTVVVGYALWLDTLPLSFHIISQFLTEDDSVLVTIGAISTGAIRVYADDNTTILGETDNPVLTAQAWDFIECKYTPTSIIVRVNRAEVLNITGLTNPQTAQWARKSTTFGDTADWWMDDIYCLNTIGGSNIDFLGDPRVYTLLPDGDDTPLDWTKSSGSTSYSLINEVGPNTTTYLESDNVSDATQVTLSDLPTDAVNIYGVQTYSYLKKTGAGSTNVKQTLVSSVDATDDDGHDLTTAWQYYKGNFEQDPDGGDWTRASVNAVKFRITRDV